MEFKIWVPMISEKGYLYLDSLSKFIITKQDFSWDSHEDNQKCDQIQLPI